MRMIKKLSAMIDDEIDGAMKYAQCAVLQKDNDPDLARTFSDLAEVELKHVSRLHEEVVRLINQARNEGKTVPAGMMEMYDYIHEGQIEKVGEVRRVLQQYKD